MIQNLETTLKAGAVPQVPQFRPAMAQPLQPVTTAKSEAPREQQKLVVNGVVGDPLGNARSKGQEVIRNEFAAIMATRSLRASEAAALATRRVMQRYGNTSSAVPQS
ncbi:uncharacterized protein LOC112027019 [Quercus suber]|uniref:uncharacterized protein LOC112027019 n=1 Tax=Quercus suber TaxID=58331 RepID=UPI0032DF3B5A